MTQISSESQKDDVLQKRAKGLFTYLRELAKLKSTPVRNIYTSKSYEKVLLFSQIPQEPECLSPIWCENKESLGEIWLEIRKPRFYPPPAVPIALRPWVDEIALKNSSEMPELYQRISAPKSEEMETKYENDNSEESSIEPQDLKLSDYPEIEKSWEQYFDEKWSRWAVENERLKKVQHSYADLHEIHQFMKKSAEEYELILGFGFLTWKTPSMQEVKRHLLVSQADIELDALSGALMVKQGAEGPNTALEEEMLEVSERCQPDVRKNIQEKIIDIGDDVWNLLDMESIIKHWVHSASANGTYSSELAPPDKSSSNPNVRFAPALILRKRNVRSLIETYNSIIKQLDQGIDIPVGIQHVVMADGEEVSSDNEIEVERPLLESDSAELFFPKFSNEEQEQVIEHLRHRQGVVVQGPPGTGKSHTIANLICHLLATGKRVLVTSQTPRALQVLKGMIPEEVEALCVSLLGHNKMAMAELTNSVQQISDHKLDWDHNPGEYDKRISSLKAQKNDLLKEKASLSRKLREVREKETYQFNICNGTYSGTAQEIAKRVSSEQDQHSWLDIMIPEDKAPPLSDDEASELLVLLRKFSLQDIEEAQKEIMDSSSLPSHDDFAEFIEKEINAKEKYETFRSFTAFELYNKLKNIPCDQFNKLKDIISGFNSKLRKILSHGQSWMSMAVSDTLSDRGRRWDHLYRISKEQLQTLESKIHSADSREIHIPDDRIRATVLDDAKTLLEHLRKGGKLRSVGIIRPAFVRKAWYLVKETYVDGKTCSDCDTLEALIESLEVDKCLEILWKEWEAYVDKTSGSKVAQFMELSDSFESLEKITELNELTVSSKDIFGQVSGLDEPVWHDTQAIERYLSTIQAVQTERSLYKATSDLDSIENNLHRLMLNPDSHPIVREIHKAVVERDEIAYIKSLEELKRIEELREQFDLRNKLLAPLKGVSEDIFERLTSQNFPDHWEEGLGHLDSSWRWAQAKTWLQEYIDKLDEKELSENLKQCEEKICETTAKLASELAWQHCLKRLTKTEEQHLRAWDHVVRTKIGMGYSKYIDRYRREARSHMEKCRSAIPAWIMPLYRVAETIEPNTGSFDVAIIDEASQSSPDAILLLFLAKRIVVVGDPEQISPSSSHIKLNEVHQLQKEYLGDVPQSAVAAMGPEDSFFAFADILFPGRVFLREHFRCVPEIIEFSNQLCYRDKPLVPLRQYPPKRVPPVVAQYIADGYRTGDVNPPEAEAIVKKIGECCNNQEYDGKTMGVISLLKDQQARLIENKLLQEIEAEEMEKRNIVCGDAYTFQGDERDVVFLSMVVAVDGNKTLTAQTRRPIIQRFNVAASRAKDQLWLFHSPTINDFRNSECVRYKLLEYCQDPKREPVTIEGLDLHELRIKANAQNRKRGDQPKPFDSWFEIDVFLKIIDRGYHVVPQFEIAGYHIDLLVRGMTRELCVECDGDHWHSDPEQREYDMRRQRQLERCERVFWRVRGSEFYNNQDQAMESLWQKLDELQIAPGGKDKDDFTIQNRSHPNKTSDTQNINTDSETNTANELPDEQNSSLNEEHEERGRLDFTPGELQEAITSVLQDCPNNSCTIKSLTKRVCKYLGVITRGSPLRRFEKRIMEVLEGLIREDRIERYKAKNERIRLVIHRW
jgi:very-short-patch-repair endonuclease